MLFVPRTNVKLHEDFYTEIVLSTGLSLGITMEAFRAFATFHLKRRFLKSQNVSSYVFGKCWLPQRIPVIYRNPEKNLAIARYLVRD